MADALTMWEELGKIDNTKVSLVNASSCKPVKPATVPIVAALDLGLFQRSFFSDAFLQFPRKEALSMLNSQKSC